MKALGIRSIAQWLWHHTRIIDCAHYYVHYKEHDNVYQLCCTNYYDLRCLISHISRPQTEQITCMLCIYEKRRLLQAGKFTDENHE